MKAAIQKHRPWLILQATTIVFLSTIILMVRPLKPQSNALLRPFRLKIVRDTGLVEVLGYNQCIQGKIYHVLSFEIPLVPPDSDWLADSIELPYRLNATSVSSIPAGRYVGTVVTGPTNSGVALGWRILLKGTAPRTGIEIHPGPSTGFTNSKNTEGCILVGKRTGQNPCWLENSAAYRDSIKNAYNDPTNQRPIEVEIVEHK